MFNHKHYVPILKSREGERWSLSHLPPPMRKHVTPVLELHPQNKPPKKKPVTAVTARKPRAPRPPKTLSDHIGEICGSLSVEWGTGLPFFLDTTWIDKVVASPADLVATTFGATRACGLLAIPVARLSYNDATLKAIGSIAAADKRGCMLRLGLSEFHSRRHIDAALAAMGLSPAQVHLLLDYRGQEMTIPDDAPRIPYLPEWATFTAASGSMPQSLADSKLHKWFPIPRADWRSWQSGVTTRGLARKPAFADYACRGFGPPASGGTPSVNLRYAAEKDWMVWVGSKITGGRSVEMKAVCADIVKRPFYSGESFSRGDAEIYAHAAEDSGPGGTGEWAAWGVSHHLVLTSNQIQSHPLL
jgi:hypothetical protein